MSLRRVFCDGDDGPGAREESVEREYVILALRGRFVFRDSAARFVVSPARAIVLRPGDRYTIEHPHREGDVCLSVTGGFAAQVADTCRRSVDVSPAGYLRVQQLLRRLAASRPVEGLFVEETLCDALASRETGWFPSRRDGAIADAIVYTIDLRFDERLVLTDLAAAAGVGVFHACRIFRRVTGMTIHHYHQMVRLRHAAALLLETSLPVSHIAVETGFANQGHLGNAFRRRFGETPARFRRVTA
ncbi:MAG TPA: AraC family transcriptional regulator [bacterium]|nr:AraC family transcriptional regulator [bacterium]